ncbi:MAG: ABC transporter permease subunit [Rhodobacteraceae bacterium]|uniref:amino acid ABC transporter permease n=1 Tax=Albidovulum sp. TaxID=1872424 RepID=UPI001E157ED3|nr:ABC transporter permease subunit [uncultured Defluviimonas sp.]MCB2126980.1 ABC transporter permease subunit [Paracoccaceae bacterium]MCC0069410.1 ABC transporter permease subunit [Paracoccaceae bacterium]
MTVVTDAPKDAFRPSMLIYDTRYRSMTIQIVVLLLFMAGAAWLVDNIVKNLQTLGKDFSFAFLWYRAGYDINQTLIPYTNDSTHGRAMFVGLVNTILVSVMGCVSATIIGVFVGILRLSRNWLVGRIMTVYVETFRNVPLLLWILVALAVFTEITPAPNQFRVTEQMIAEGTEPEATMSFFDSIAITNRGTYVPAPEVSRSLGSFTILDVPISLNVLAFLVAVAIAVFGYRAIKAHASRVQEATGVRPVTWWKSLLMLLVPPVGLLVAMGFHLSYPELAGFNFKGGINVSNALMSLWLALTLYTAAFIAEIVRAGIMAISKGQTEAAFALGLRPGRTMNLIILPQALRVIIPPLISQYLNLMKNSSLAIAVSYMDLRGTLGGITLNQTGRELECILLMMLIYLALSLLISSAMNVYNNAVKLKER